MVLWMVYSARIFHILKYFNYMRSNVTKCLNLFVQKLKVLIISIGLIFIVNIVSPLLNKFYILRINFNNVYYLKLKHIKTFFGKLSAFDTGMILYDCQLFRYDCSVIIIFTIAVLISSVLVIYR